MTFSFNNLKFKYKIIFSILPLVIAMCILILLSFLMQFENAYREDAVASANQWLELSSNSFMKEVSDIIDTSLSIVSSTDMNDILKSQLNNQISQFDFRLNLQPIITEIKNISPLIEDIYFIDKQSNIYYDFSRPIINDRSNILSFEYLKQIKGIAFLESLKSPFSYSEVLPVAIPLTLLGGRYVAITGEESNLILVILLDLDNISAILNQTKSSYLASYCYLSLNGKPIARYDIHDRDYHSIRSTYGYRGLYVNLDYSIEPYLRNRTKEVFLSIIISIVIISIASAIVIFLADFLTRPFSMLMNIIEEIKQNTYKLDKRPKFKDETGILIEALNSLYITVNEQMILIKEKEKESAMYQRQILTEQINPHFIYNTLEVINQDVIRGHIDIASQMIQDFAKCLRLSLNYGSDTVQVEQEIEEAKAYMNIMNHRLNMVIDFTIEANEDSLKVYIPKMILQPLIENSIKHGFENGLNNPVMSGIPFIKINITKASAILTITITDNGVGIDKDKVIKSIFSEKNEKHIGLKNIYSRLKIFFGNVNIKTESIPFFQNSIAFIVKTENN